MLRFEEDDTEQAMNFTSFSVAGATSVPVTVKVSWKMRQSLSLGLELPP